MSQGTVDLRPIIRAVERVGQTLSTQIDQVDTQVGMVRGDLATTQSELRQLRDQFEEYVEVAARTARVQQSETRVVNLKAELDRQYGHYADVRLTSVGLLQAFDVGNVGNDVARQVSEELMIRTPRYWLAPVVVALAAWSRDNQDMAEKSIREAFSRDPNKTSLFFALVTRRQGRVDAAGRWLKHYLTSLDPSALGREFAVILEATSYNAFGPAAQKTLTDTMTTWAEELRSNVDIVEAQVRTWAGEIGSQREQLAPNTYENLEQLSPEWPRVKRMLEQASALPVATDKYEAIAAHEAPMPTALEHMLDDILDRLVTEYDGEELPLRREVVFHEAIIEEQGDLSRARERSDLLQKALDETSDVVSLQTTAAISPELVGVSSQTQRIAIGVGQDDFATAVGRYCTVYRTDAVNQVPLEFNQQHSQFASTYGFQGCTLNTAMNEQDGIAQIRATWQATLAAYIDSISFKNSWYTKPALIAGVIAVVVFFINPWAGLVALAGGAGIVYFLGEQQRKKCQAAVAAVEAIRDQAVEHSISRYRDANAEFVDAMGLYADLDAQERELLNVINTWPTAPSKES